MSKTRTELLRYLDELGIEHHTIDHPPVFTVEEAAEHTSHLPGAHTKNLFLRNKKKDLYLATVLAERRVNLNALAKTVGAGRFSFGKPELLREVLGVEPGSVTPLALINDIEHRVHFILDAAILEHEIVNVHPLTNTATTAMHPRDLCTFIDSLGHTPHILDLSEMG